MLRGMAKITVALAATMAVISVATRVEGTSLLRRNLAELTMLAEHILVGKVVALSDGFEGNVPYTKVTIRVTKSIKGSRKKTFTFKQFGLIEPRDMGNGYTNLNVSPPGWPRFKKNEKVIVFLYKSAALTGLRTTVGLMQGKFTIKDGRIYNGVDNLGLFRNISVPLGKLTKAERSMLQMKKGPIDADTFISFLDKAVQNNWFK